MTTLAAHSAAAVIAKAFGATSAVGAAVFRRGCRASDTARATGPSRSISACSIRMGSAWCALAAAMTAPSVTRACGSRRPVDRGAGRLELLARAQVQPQRVVALAGGAAPARHQGRDLPPAPRPNAVGIRRRARFATIRTIHSTASACPRCSRLCATFAATSRNRFTGPR